MLFNGKIYIYTVKNVVQGKKQQKTNILRPLILKMSGAWLQQHKGCTCKKVDDEDKLDGVAICDSIGREQKNEIVDIWTKGEDTTENKSRRFRTSFKGIAILKNLKTARQTKTEAL